MVYRRRKTIFRGLVPIKPSALRSERHYRYCKSAICPRSIHRYHPDFNNHFSEDTRACRLRFESGKFIVEEYLNAK